MQNLSRSGDIIGGLKI